MNEEVAITDIGVIIGRFQVPELHPAHKRLIEFVLERHKKTIIFLGVPHTLGTSRNPLDFVSRKLMIEEEYEDISAILPLKDQNSDYYWSNILDSKIREIFPLGSVTLYGSRDSFIPHYKGSNETYELPSLPIPSGSESRKEVFNKILSSRDFRAGVIHGVMNTYPTLYSCIDVAIEMPNGKYLMAKKPGEDKFRFVGGFVDINDSNDETTCRREAYEETNVEIDEIKYITSSKIDDWRYRKEINRGIMTRFFHSKYIMGNPQPQDDIIEIKEFNLEELNETNFVRGHLGLLEKLKKYKNEK